MEWMMPHVRIVLLLWVATVALGEFSPPAVSPSVGDVSDNAVTRIMPFGDSLTTCCHYCAVVEGILPPSRRKELAEPPMPYSGYIRHLWHLLRQRTNSFSYVGRVLACMKNSSLEMRVPDDWDVRYEGYYGFTTQRLGQLLPGALSVNKPNIVLMMAGTNDLIATIGPETSNQRVDRAFRALKGMIRLIMQSGVGKDEALPCPGPGVSVEHIPKVFLGVVPPIDFSILGGTRHGAKLKGKGWRVTRYNALIESLDWSRRGTVRVLDATASPNDKGEEGWHRANCSESFIRGVPNRLIASRVFIVRHSLDIRKDFHGDGLHPNEKGEQKLGAAFAAAVLPHLRVSDSAEGLNPLSREKGLAVVVATSNVPITRNSGERNSPTLRTVPSSSVSSPAIEPPTIDDGVGSFSTFNFLWLLGGCCLGVVVVRRLCRRTNR